jgi:beta-lactamase superfamily II metal-dependent hydrolase
MGALEVTLIDVGWGDSILIEAVDNNSNESYGLIDSNDTTKMRSSIIFLKRYFERKGVNVSNTKHIFEFVLLSHVHSDHSLGLKEILRTFGCKRFWYSKANSWGSTAELIRYAINSSRVVHYDEIDNTKVLTPLGNVSMDVLWPGPDQIYVNENNNSVVLSMKLGKVTFMLTGDAEEQVWTKIGSQIPSGTQFFKVPHHGSVNGTFNNAGDTPWFNGCPNNAALGISSHIYPHTHPDQKVIDLFTRHRRNVFRTDQHYHVTFRTDGNSTQVKYSRY